MLFRSSRAGGASGGGGSYGGEGGPGASGAAGIQYGSAGLENLFGGSGGGSGNLGDAGAGGGAIEINATGKITVLPGVRISMRGGSVFVHPDVGANFSGGAGSGGAIRLLGSSIENLGSLDVRGGDASGADPREPGARFLRHAGGAGGGGAKEGGQGLGQVAGRPEAVQIAKSQSTSPPYTSRR